MKYRRLGETGIKASEIGFGCGRLGNSYLTEMSDDKGVALVHKALDLGINIFDTSSTYRYGASERILGKAFQNKRDKVVIVTKAGKINPKIAKSTGFAKKITRTISKLTNPMVRPIQQIFKNQLSPSYDFSKDHLEKSLVRSLKRLKTDYVDVLLLHNPALDTINYSDVFETLESFKKRGLILHYGVSIDHFEEAMAAIKFPIDVMEIYFNLLQNSEALKILGHQKSQKLGILVKTPFAKGMLTSRRKISISPREMWNKKILEQKMDHLSSIIGQRNLSHIALQYILKHEQISSVLCGTSSLNHLEENLRFDQTKQLTDEELNRIKKIQAHYPM